MATESPPAPAGRAGHYTDDDLDAAVDAGVFDARRVAAFREQVRARRVEQPLVDEEQFRLVSGFNDIFVVIACALLMGSLVWIARSLVGDGVGTIVVAIASWLLAEYFVRRRRMALPALVLLGTFVGAAFLAVPAIVGPGNATYGVAGAVAAVAAALHWWRFRVPITVAAGCAASGVALIAGAIAITPDALRYLPLMLFGAGVAVFTLALRWDAADTRRLTRSSDVAFWLHLLAAPLLVHPVFSALAAVATTVPLLQVAAVVALYVVLGLVSLAIDRRALMVSSLAYVLYAFGSLFREQGAVSLRFALTALLIASALLLLSAFWHRARGGVLRLLPRSWQQRLPALRELP